MYGACTSCRCIEFQPNHYLPNQCILCLHLNTDHAPQLLQSGSLLKNSNFELAKKHLTFSRRDKIIGEILSSEKSYLYQLNTLIQVNIILFWCNTLVIIF